MWVTGRLARGYTTAQKPPPSPWLSQIAKLLVDTRGTPHAGHATPARLRRRQVDFWTAQLPKSNVLPDSKLDRLPETVLADVPGLKC